MLRCVLLVALVLSLGGVAEACESSAAPDSLPSVSGCVFVPLGVRPPVEQAFVVGVTYLLKNAPPSGPAGAFAPVVLPDCAADTSCSGSSGATRFLCQMIEGSPCPPGVGECLSTQTGNMSGPTATAIQQRIESDTDSRIGTTYGEYHGNGRRVVLVPVVELTGGCGAGVLMTGTGLFFITNYVSGTGTSTTVYVEYLGAFSTTAAKRSTWGELKSHYR